MWGLKIDNHGGLMMQKALVDAVVVIKMSWS